jgi:hypothetical protein
MNTSNPGVPSTSHRHLDAPGAGSTGSRAETLYRAGGAAALTVGGLFLLAGLSLIISMALPSVMRNWLMPLQNNWLLVLFQLNANIGGANAGLLDLNLLDSLILVLTGITLLDLYAALRETSRIWRLIATAQPFVGLALFLVTKMVGRSAVMGAVLVISLVMLRNHRFSRPTAVMGIAASVLLLAGDMFTSFEAPSAMLAGFIATGYVLLTAWFFVISRRLWNASISSPLNMAARRAGHS